MDNSWKLDLYVFIIVLSLLGAVGPEAVLRILNTEAS